MRGLRQGFVPPFCPNRACLHHGNAVGWRFKKKGFYKRRVDGRSVQRYLCLHCRVSFSRQTFQVTYWLKRPDLLGTLFYRVLACSAYRQIGRELGLSHTTVLRQVERLGRHCLLFHETLRPRTGLVEPLVVDGFESFEFSQYTPIHLNVAVGAHSHYVYAFTDAELRRKGRMSAVQKRRRAELETLFGRPDPKAIEREIAALVELVVGPRGSACIRSDEHTAYPRALRRLGPERFVHQVTSSKRPRTRTNPLFPVNLLDLLIRHSSANHKRETIAFSKRRQGAAERLAILQVWRNYMKSFSERKRDRSPAQRLGIVARKLGIGDVLRKRLFPIVVGLPSRLMRYYRREVDTRRIPNPRRHRLRYAY